jgi:hypothetical protein
METRIGSPTVEGRRVTKAFFHPGAKVDIAMSQMTAAAQGGVRQMSPGATPPCLLIYSASRVPILQLAMSGEGLSEQQLFDIPVPR